MQQTLHLSVDFQDDQEQDMGVGTSKVPIYVRHRLEGLDPSDFR
jgi:hypothetical protein